MQLSAPTNNQTVFLGHGGVCVCGGGVCSVGAVIGVYISSEEELWREENKKNVKKRRKKMESDNSVFQTCIIVLFSGLFLQLFGGQKTRQIDRNKSSCDKFHLVSRRAIQ